MTHPLAWGFGPSYGLAYGMCAHLYIACMFLAISSSWLWVKILCKVGPGGTLCTLGARHCLDNPWLFSCHLMTENGVLQTLPGGFHACALCNLTWSPYLTIFVRYGACKPYCVGIQNIWTTGPDECMFIHCLNTIYKLHIKDTVHSVNTLVKQRIYWISLTFILYTYNKYWFYTVYTLCLHSV